MNAKIDEIAAELTGSFVTKLQEQISKQVQADVMRKLSLIDLTQSVHETVVKEVSRLVKLDSVMLSGDRIIGGIIKNFGSTGIQDAATDCRITILDDNTVVENNLVVSSVEVKGNLTVDGDLILTKEVQDRLDKQVANGVSSELAALNLPQTVTDLATKTANSYIVSIQGRVKAEVEKATAEFDLSEAINKVAAEQTELLVKSMTDKISTQVQADLARQLGTVDIKQTVAEYVARQLSSMISTVDFPEKSIPGAVINLDGYTMSGSHINGGVVEHFGSTGIQDNASSCQITILDEATVVENKLVAAGAEIKGDLVVDGDLILTGEIPSSSPFYKDLVQHAAGLLKLSMDKEFFLQYANLLFDQVQKEGIDTSKLTLNGKEVVVGNRIGRSITDSNLQRLGELRELIVRGATSLANNTLYVQNGRVGINTEEPSCALSVWDDGCEVTVRKLRKDVSVVGSLREQRVVLSANNKENLTLEIDGSVTVDRLNVGDNQFGSISKRPTHNEKPGVILFNSNPQIGLPMFWMSLGGARWIDGPKIG